jgi:biopolymer transport protein ExbB/TolQ
MPASLNLGVSSVQAPMGLVLLGLLVLVLVVFLLSLVFSETSHLLEVRRLTRESAEQRKLADTAEASRFTELRHFLSAEIQATVARERELNERLQEKLDRVQNRLVESIEQTGNGLSASLGELEDRLERQGHLPGAHGAG